MIESRKKCELILPLIHFVGVDENGFQCLNDAIALRVGHVMGGAQQAIGIDESIATVCDTVWATGFVMELTVGCYLIAIVVSS